MIKYSLLGILALFLISCSEGDDTGLSNQMLPLAEGNYWIYETVRDGEVAVKFYDSTYISGMTEKLGENCYVMESVTGFNRGDYEPDVEISHYRTEATRIYTFSDFLTNQIEETSGGLLPFEIEEQWLLIVNSNDDLWRVYQQEIDNQLFFGSELKGTIDVYGVNEGVEMLEIMGSNMNASKFKAEIELFASTSFQGLPISIDIKTNAYFYFVEGIGLVKTVTEATEVEIPGLFEREIPASESVLIEYSVR